MTTLIDDLIKSKPIQTIEYTPKDFKSPLEVRWCAGCGSYSILAQVQKILAGLKIPREKYAFISGIGCSSRFPYYIQTYGIHTIHGRAIAIATGLKIARPDLSIWVVTGDGDCMSIGGNHLIHAARRNIGLKVLMFNNEIYSLTKARFRPQLSTVSQLNHLLWKHRLSIQSSFIGAWFGGILRCPNISTATQNICKQFWNAPLATMALLLSRYTLIA
jgi:Pyruvate:ferredoxin oxidoreductase and related 2-oxoacid:ferredoxin oxidoreductases, beta subunit